MQRKIVQLRSRLRCNTFFSSREFLFPSPGKQLDVRQVDGQYETFTLVEKTVKQRLAQFISDSPRISTTSESLLAGSMAMGLCYIARIQRNKAPGVMLNSRILVVTGSNECASQYMTYMNVFFTAQKQNIVIDVCALDKSLGLLQQGCDVTGGQYLNLPHLDGLLQYLLVSWCTFCDQNLNNDDLLSVGLSAGTVNAQQTRPATARQGRLSCRLLLSPRSDRYRLCVFCLSVK
jgi:transcription factor TFB4